MTLKIISTPITGSSLARMSTERARSAWLADPPRGGGAWRERAASVRSGLVRSDWLAALQPAIGGGGVAAARLARASESGFVVTSGQQPGLFGGPLYTWWKALSILALADALEELTGMPVAPVFWAATDDSDFAEASATVVAGTGGTVRIEMSEPPGTGVSLAQVPIGDLSAQIAALEAAAGSAPGSPALELVERAYAPGNTIGGAYVALLRSILEPLGIAVLDAAHPAVRETAHPVLIRALERSDTIEAALKERSRVIKAAGQAVQVNDVPGRTLVFSESRGRRERVPAGDADSVAVTAPPGTLGPNVLLRPIVEMSILPTVAYMGGPAEIAYFAQVSAVADALGVSTPVVAPRWSGFVIEPRVARILDRWELRLEDFRDPHAVESRLARESVPEAVASEIARLKSSLEGAIERLQVAEGADLVSPGVIEGLSRNMLHRIARLERRFAASVKRRGNDALRDAAIARGSLFPFGVPQERVLNGIPLLARYGDELLSRVLAEARNHAASLT